MKITFLTLLLFSVTACFGQTHNIAVGVSNNGQLSQVGDAFYFDGQNMSFFFVSEPTITRQQSSWKATAEYSYQLGNRLEFGLNGGFGQRKESRMTKFGMLKASQQYFSLLPFFLKRWPLGKLEFALGGGFPVHFAGTFSASSRQDLQPSGMSVVGNNNLTGGYAYGISAISRIKWLFTPRFSLMATASFGVLYTHFGGELKGYSTFNNDALLISVYARKQTGFSLPAAELSVGIGFRI